MPSDPPVSFQQLAQSGGDPATGGYPYQIRASDLDKNFVYATLDADESLLETTTGTGGHTQRKLKLNPGTADYQVLFWKDGRFITLTQPPSSGTHVLGAVNGVLQWIATEEC
jgi:hypothetical protein